MHDGQLADLLVHCFGDARLTSSMTAESALLGVNRRTFGRRICEVAAVCHFGCRALVGSVFSRVLMEVARGSFRIVAVVTCAAYDETPLPMRAPPPNTEACNPEVGHAFGDAQRLEQLPFPLASDKGTMKVVQSTSSITLVLQPPSGALAQLQFVLMNPLQVLDRATARNLRENLERQVAVPLLQEIQGVADISCHISMSDSASANLAAEEVAQGVSPSTWRLKLPCAAHAVSTVQGRTYSTVADVITGIISFALQRCIAGAVSVQKDLARCQALPSITTATHWRCPSAPHPVPLWRFPP